MRALSAALLLVYAPLNGNAVQVTTDDTFTIVPDPLARIVGVTARTSRTRPNRFVSNCRRSSSSSISSTAARKLYPALLIRTSMGPALSAAATADSTDAVSSS